MPILGRHLFPSHCLLRSHSVRLAEKSIACLLWYRSLKYGASLRQVRGAKRKASITLPSLQQGSLGPSALEPVDGDNSPAYPAVVQGHLNNVKKFQGCAVLTRVGNFYELYAEQAEKYGPLLNLKVARRKTALGPVAMSGFQHYQLDRYLKILVQDLNTSVAISDEIRNSPSEQVKAGGLMYNRKVTRVITAGTLIDESFVDPYENNFLLSIYSPTDAVQELSESMRNSGRVDTQPNAATVGLAWVDLSSGDFFTQEINVDSIGSVVARVAPCEIIVNPSVEAASVEGKADTLREFQHMVTQYAGTGCFDEIHTWNEMIDRNIDHYATSFSTPEVLAGSLLLDYVQSKLQNTGLRLKAPIRRTGRDVMEIDRYSLRGLEIRETMRDGFSKGSLLHAIRCTVTKSGTRALTQRILSPSLSQSTIEGRLDLVQEFLEDEEAHFALRTMLERTYDTPRLLTKFSIGRGDADDLLAIGKTIDMMERIFRLVRDRHSRLPENLPRRFQDVAQEIESIDFAKLLALSKRISNSIDEDALSRQHNADQDEISTLENFAEEVEEADGTTKRPRRPSSKTAVSGNDDDGEIWIMRRDASKFLHAMHEDLDAKYNSKGDLVQQLRESLGLKSITLRWLPNTRHFCHVKGKDARQEIKGAINISTSKTTRTFVLPQWTALGKELDEVKLRIRAEEQIVFNSLRDEVIANLVKLRRSSSILDELDIACSSAQVAKDQAWVRPLLSNRVGQTIIGGRHPMVDVGLQEAGRSFTSNDCTMTDDEQIMLITGPNMAGKSTYLRQNALITILAQTGCYVPAEYAEIGLVDKIFSRVGAADNVYNHQSTFMVEMVEVAEILNQATRRSFVIMDEVGRGTTPEDGIAVGFACLKYLHDKVGCRTLFATHFHDLADMTRNLQRVSRWCTDVDEDSDGSWTYNHRLRIGVNRDSHALKVAQLAGMPAEAVNTAKEVLQRLDSKPALQYKRPLILYGGVEQEVASTA